jgi:serine/threonine protein kinase
MSSTDNTVTEMATTRGQETPAPSSTALRSRITLFAVSPRAIRWLIPLVVGLGGLLIAIAGQRSLVRSTEDLTRARFEEETLMLAESVSHALASADPILDSLRDSVLSVEPTLNARADATRDAVMGHVAHRFADAVRAHEGVVYASASFPDGSFLGAYLEPDGKLRFQVSRAPKAESSKLPGGLEPGVRRRYDLRGFNSLVLQDEAPTVYDPRPRPFYALALRSSGRVWSEPYLFYEDHATGLTRTEALYRGTTLVAILTVDFNLAALSKLITTRAGTDEVVALLHTDEGGLLALPESLRPKTPSEKPTTFHEVESTLVRAFFDLSVDARIGKFKVPREGEALAVSSRVQNLGGLAWTVTALVPESVQARIVGHHRTRSLVALGAALVLSIALGTLLANWLERAQRLTQAAQAAARAAEARAEEAEGLAKKLGSYELVQCLGKGGMGEVWRGAHRLLPRDAAIKLIRPDTLNSENRAEMQARFRREARSLAQLKCRNTVSILDYGVASDGALFLVMELLDGMDAEKMLYATGPMPAERVVHLMIQACRSLAEAHALQLVHRDIKPANIFLARAGTEVDIVKVLDFGLVHDAHKPGTHETGNAAQALAIAPPASTTPPAAPESLKNALALDLTQQGSSMGTPSYMAPEQVLGHAVSAATDVYALGCVMVFLLTGKKLFTKPDTVSLMMAHVIEPVPDFEKWATVPNDLAKLIRSCLEKTASDRPKDGQDLLAQLEEIEAAIDLPWTANRARTFWSQLPEVPTEVSETSNVPQHISIEATAATSLDGTRKPGKQLLVG